MLRAFVLLSIMLSGQVPQALIQQLRDQDPLVRIKAAKSLGTLEVNGKDALPALKKTATDDADEEVRVVAKRAVKKIEQSIAEHQGRDVLDPLINSLRTGNAQSKAVALDKLKDLGPQAEQTSEYVIAALVNPSKLVREKAMTTLESINPKMYKSIVTLMVNRDIRVRSEAIQLIRDLGEKGRPAAPFLIERVKQTASNYSSEENVRILDCLDATAFDMPEFSELLLWIIRSPAQSNRRQGGRGSDSGLRWSAISHLKRQVEEGLIGPKQAAAALIEAMNDEANLVAAIRCLETLGREAKAAVPSLMRVKLHPNQEVREAVADAIEKISM